jgi:hypothetical protein
LKKFITGQNEREETTQDAIVTKSAAFASYEILFGEGLLGCGPSECPRKLMIPEGVDRVVS